MNHFSHFCAFLFSIIAPVIILCVDELNILMFLLQKDTVHKPRGCIRLDTSIQLKKMSNSALFEVREDFSFHLTSFCLPVDE